MPHSPASETAAPYIRREQEGGLLRLTLNRPEQFNPLSAGMIGALSEVLDRVARDESVRAIILRAEGRGFCAGHDLREMREHLDDDPWQRALFESCNQMMIKLTQLPQPTIARVHGIATAAGCQLVSMCDLAVAEEGARFALPGVNIGLFCSTPAVGVSRNIGRKRSMEMLLTGEMIGAAQARDWGLVNRVVPAERLDEEVQRLADRILARSAATIALGKKAFYMQLESGFDGAYRVAGAAMARNARLEDAEEGIAAFLEKRAPNWRNA